MNKRGIFSKIFSINMVSMIVCIIILGSTQTLMLTNYIARYSENNLTKNAETLIAMINGNGNISIDSMYGLINGISRASGSYVFVFDSRGKVLASSADSSIIARKPIFIDSEFTKVVLSGEKYTGIGSMGGIFTRTMFTLQLPIYGQDKQVLGAVSLSKSIPEQQKMQYDLYKILLISMVVIALTSFFLSYILARRISVPIRMISNSAREFAKGNFAARVDADVENSDVSEISELAEAFNHMVAELEKAEEIKNTFISDVSHELRTPMTTISGFVSGMLDDTIPSQKHKEYLSIVYDEVNRLSRLVNTFLDITRLQSDKLILNKTRFDINEVIRIVVIGFESKISNKNIDITLDFNAEKCYAFADKDSITRVLTNLLDNAVKFTDQNGSIVVTVDQKHNGVVVSVRNTGKGIPEDKLPMIFKRFYKADKSRSTNKEGTGIGLYLVKNIISAHGHNITVKSVEGEYAEFVFTLDRGKQTQSKENL